LIILIFKIRLADVNAGVNNTDNNALAGKSFASRALAAFTASELTSSSALQPFAIST